MNSIFRAGLIALGCLLMPVRRAGGEHLSTAERISPERLKAAHEEREKFERERQNLPNFGPYEDFRAVIHIHAEDAPHTKGTRAEVLAAAKKTGVKIVMWTDHGGPHADTWHGVRDGVLFIPGEENGGAGFLRFPETEHGSEMRFLSHIEERYDAATEGMIGMEICNRHTDAVLDKSLQKIVVKAAGNPDSWQELTTLFKKYPDELFAAGTDYHEKIFQKWDEETGKKPFTGIGANDAHQNQIVQGVTFDPYAVSFRNLSTHILARELNEKEIRTALREGHAYVSHDWLCDPSGFTFGAANTLGVFSMGDPVILVKNTRVVALTPLAAQLKLFHNGSVIAEQEGTNLTWRATEPGTYRVEAWLKVAGEERPWIYSNPVYLRAPALSDLTLPSFEIDPKVAVKKDVAYGENGDDAPRHKLDVYSPRETNSAPVFFFVHGGAWKSGDKSQYGPVGNCFAKEGIVTVIPNYRLAPGDPHPAQIEDVAAAFAWTARHISEFGGDTNLIFIGGHSAGGHLAALLALNHRYLERHGIGTKAVRGVIALSGVYDLVSIEGQASVFGSNSEIRREASPLFQVRAPAPPFLVSWCEWDYPSLPAQGREFAGTLRKAGVPVRTLFVPRENHISEMVHVPKEGNIIAQAILDFIGAVSAK